MCSPLFYTYIYVTLNLSKILDKVLGIYTYTNRITILKEFSVKRRDELVHKIKK